MIETSHLEEPNKVYIMGSEGVGKSNLVAHLLNEEFIDEESLTYGINIKRLKNNDTIITFKVLYDNQDYKYTQIFKNEMEDVKAVLIVFSVIDKESYDYAKFLVEFIMKNITNNYMHIILCGNKYDMNDNPECLIDFSDIFEYLIMVPNSIYFETSCKTGLNICQIKKYLLSIDLDDSTDEKNDQIDDDPAEKNSVSMINDFPCIIY